MAILTDNYRAYEVEFNNEEGHKDILVFLIKSEGLPLEDVNEFIDRRFFKVIREYGDVRIEHHSSLHLPKVIQEQI